MTVDGLRERKKVETRAALRAAALALALEHGPDAITLEQVCERAGVGRRTFFNYFASKDDAVVGWSDEHLAEIQELVRSRPQAESSAEAAARAVEQVLDLCMEAPTWHAQLDLVRRHPQIVPRFLASTQPFEDSVSAGLSARAGAASDDTSLIAAAACTVMRLAVRRWMENPTGMTPAAHARTLFALLGGLRFPPAHA